MHLTPSQVTILKNDIEADPVLSSQPNDADGNTFIASVYETTFSPDFWVWRTSITKADILQATGPEGTTFNWVGNGFITRSVGEQTAWHELFDGGSCNPSLANVRQAFSDIFSGSGNAAANRTHLLAVGRRKANRFEKLFATGVGSTASPATLGIGLGGVTLEGMITSDEVQAARNS